ncbi:MAG: hypothetical protein J7574_07270 [Flavobacterium sp.]|uniref:hypothetical protein n=1 Tax=Flavobacterium sp. TaxID=239 RepID=UPI001B12D77F|nr:hypothetical protein [Flavobacterium sp.]MBO9583941.1 hypothetical protein [Flavobacterium sp.]
MNSFSTKILGVIILISLNYSCDALCNDEDTNRNQKEAAVHQKTDSLNVSTMD